MNTPVVGNVGLKPFVSSMTVSGAGLTPTLSWSLPSVNDLQAAGVSVDETRVFIVDNTPGYRVTSTSRSPTVVRSFQQGDLISRDLVVGNSYQIPSGLLQFGHQYSIGIVLADTRVGGTTQSRSVSYFDFTPLNSSIAGDVYLPTTVPVPTTAGITAGPVYSFSQVPAGPNSVTFIDPVVATGFEYHTADGDPNFKSVQVASNVGDGSYELWVWNNAMWTLLDGSLLVDETYDFTANGFAAGVDAFQIRGIETRAALSPFDLTAFVTGLTFVANGTFNGTMRALAVETAGVPEPPLLILMFTAFGLVVLVRLAAQRVEQAV